MPWTDFLFRLCKVCSRFFSASCFRIQQLEHFLDLPHIPSLCCLLNLPDRPDHAQYIGQYNVHRVPSQENNPISVFQSICPISARSAGDPKLQLVLFLQAYRA